MNIADLFVRIRGDTSDLDRKLRGTGNALDDVDKKSRSSHVSLGRLGNQFENLASRSIGVNPVVSKMSAVLSDFAIGSTLTVGVLAGVAAVATVWDKLTESSRKAMEVGDKLAATYQEEARITALGIGGKYKADIEDLTKAMQENAKWTGLLGTLQSQGGPFAAVAGLFTGGLSKRQEGLAAGLKQADLDKLMAEIEAQDDMMVARNKRELDSLNEQIQNEKDAVSAAAKEFKKFTDTASSALSIFDSLSQHGATSKAINDVLVQSYDQVQAKLQAIGDKASVARMQLLQLANALRENIVVSQHIASVNSTGTVGPLAGKTLPGVSITTNGAIGDAVNNVLNGPMKLVRGGGVPELTATEKEGQKQAEEDAKMLAQTISNTASIIGGIIGNALGFIGSSRGNQIGGGIGATIGGGLGSYIGKQLTTAGGAYIGGALGSVVGSIVPVVGTIIGGFLGSQIGGLFGHHAKALDNNTRSTDRNTAVMEQLLNAPSGFKVASARYDATDVKAFHLAVRRYNSRGGAPMFGTP